MSAGAVPELRATADNLRFGVKFEVPDTLPDTGGAALPAHQPRTGASGPTRAADPLAELGQRQAALSANAVDVLEIAAGLEADGLTDQAVRARYGLPNVFDLAEHLRQHTPSAPTDRAAPPNPWQARPATHLVRGLLFGLPALCYTAAAPLIAGRTGFTLVMVSVLLAWSLSQGLAYLGYARMSQPNAPGLVALLRGGMLAAVLAVSAALTVTVTLVGSITESWSALLFAIGQGAYLMAATVLLVQGGERWLLISLAPAVLASAAFLVLDRPAWLFPLAVPALATSVVLVLELALCWSPQPEQGARWDGRPQVSGRELANALPHAGYGLTVAGLVAFPSVIGTAPFAAMVVLPLSLSMGPAEWLLYRYRARIYDLLRGSHGLRGFASGARRTLAGTVGRYLASTAVLVLAALAIAIPTGYADPLWTALLCCVAYLALGAALMLSLMLQTCGFPLVALGTCALALLTEIALVGTGLLDLVVGQCAVSLALLAVLATHALVALADPARHH
ncbi:hypothetical protein [Goodfellowiella coeruleoviolacea]|uniref:Uncharacterized protein n=1 Tax=Goodfellowiella coeruleoviolacea TaxID=334858 RepID=A0AAE3GC24_9PSEU|nr:hypothetical protein [Goodfellowiella coeruleoviolacea]MCP2165536.1 hypothetical protein [Goodfellowiella coeruleoviolacea]